MPSNVFTIHQFSKGPNSIKRLPNKNSPCRAPRSNIKSNRLFSHSPESHSCAVRWFMREKNELWHNIQKHETWMFGCSDVLRLFLRLFLRTWISSYKLNGQQGLIHLRTKSTNLHFQIACCAYAKVLHAGDTPFLPISFCAELKHSQVTCVFMVAKIKI